MTDYAGALPDQVEIFEGATILNEYCVFRNVNFLHVFKKALLYVCREVFYLWYKLGDVFNELPLPLIDL